MTALKMRSLFLASTGAALILSGAAFAQQDPTQQLGSLC
jgi:hypothetical protein